MSRMSRRLSEKVMAQILSGGPRVTGEHYSLYLRLLCTVLV